MDVLMNWIVALCALVLFFGGLYVVIKAAVRAAVKESLRELGHEVAKKVWEEDETPRS